MKFEEVKKKRLVRNAILSLFIYMLPIALMLLTLYITGERPWLKKHGHKENSKSFSTRNNTGNGNND